MLELKNLRLTAEDGQGKVDILKDVSLSVADGEFLVITGPNGGGKTSLAKTSAPGAASPTASSSRRASRA